MFPLDGIFTRFSLSNAINMHYELQFLNTLYHLVLACAGFPRRVLERVETNQTTLNLCKILGLKTPYVARNYGGIRI